MIDAMLIAITGMSGLQEIRWQTFDWSLRGVGHVLNLRLKNSFILSRYSEPECGLDQARCT